MGRLPLDYGIWFCLNGFLCGLVGQLLVDYLVKKYKKTSIIVIVLSISIGLSTILMGSVGIAEVVRDIRDEAYLGFKSPC